MLLLALLVLTLLVAVILWPKRGLLARRRLAEQVSHRVRTEDALKYLYKCNVEGRQPALEGIAGVLRIDTGEVTLLLAQMQQGGLINIEGESIVLTQSGSRIALHVIRAHRLWESYLAEETGFDQATWHVRADELEHTTTPADANNLSTRLGNPAYDPHGDPIPTLRGYKVHHGGEPLPTLPVNAPGRIVHLEDEPELIYAQLAAEGLHPGMPVRIVESTPERVRFWANGDEHVLAPIVANNISVVPIQESKAIQETTANLAMLEIGETAVVSSISLACPGRERRRFLDLGILAGTPITSELRSPGGDPVAYRIRGALIALRNDQARLIKVRSSDQPAEAGTEDR